MKLKRYQIILKKIFKTLVLLEKIRYFCMSLKLTQSLFVKTFFLLKKRKKKNLTKQAENYLVTEIRL
jgi:prolyl-tRNA editing enzyme YbaK/EbsC (Cys-tRNA(Pro) deacylase)